MKNTISELRIRFSLLALTVLFGSIVAFAQGSMAPDLSGTYEGIVKMPGAPEGKVSLELKNDGGKISGRAIHGPKTVEITEAKLENGTLTVRFDQDHAYVARVDGDKLVGEVSDGPKKFPLELKKVSATAAAAPVAAAPAGASPIAAAGSSRA